MQDDVSFDLYALHSINEDEHKKAYYRHKLSMKGMNLFVETRIDEIRNCSNKCFEIINNKLFTNDDFFRILGHIIRAIKIVGDVANQKGNSSDSEYIALMYFRDMLDICLMSLERGEWSHVQISGNINLRYSFQRFIGSIFRNNWENRGTRNILLDVIKKLFSLSNVLFKNFVHTDRYTKHFFSIQAELIRFASELDTIAALELLDIMIDGSILPYSEVENDAFLRRTHSVLRTWKRDYYEDYIGIDFSRFDLDVLTVSAKSSSILLEVLYQMQNISILDRALKVIINKIESYYFGNYDELLLLFRTGIIIGQEGWTRECINSFADYLTKLKDQLPQNPLSRPVPLRVKQELRHLANYVGAERVF